MKQFKTRELDVADFGKIKRGAFARFTEVKTAEEMAAIRESILRVGQMVAMELDEDYNLMLGIEGRDKAIAELRRAGHEIEPRYVVVEGLTHMDKVHRIYNSNMNFRSLNNKERKKKAELFMIVTVRRTPS